METFEKWDMVKYNINIDHHDRSPVKTGIVIEQNEKGVLVRFPFGKDVLIPNEDLIYLSQCGTIKDLIN